MKRYSVNQKIDKKRTYSKASFIDEKSSLTEKPELLKQEETVKPEAEKPKEEEKSKKKNPRYSVIRLIRQRGCMGK